MSTRLKKLHAPADAAVVALDEFALQSTTTTHYAWAEKNTAPSVPSHERRRTRLNGWLAVELHSGHTTVDFQPQANVAHVVLVLALIVLRYAQQGYLQLVFILDNRATHGQAMKRELAALLAQIPLAATIAVDFLHTPVYSPAFNPAEYLIHQVRKNALYHLPVTLTVPDRANRIRRQLAQAPPLNPQQIQNILHHVDRLPKNGWS